MLSFLRRSTHFSQGVTTPDIWLTGGLDIRLLDSVETWLFSAIFQFFYSLTIVSTDIWLIFKYISNYLLVAC